MSAAYSDHFDALDDDGVTVVRTTTATFRHPHQAQELGEELARLVDRDGHTRVALNLAKTHYLGSTAYSVLINLARKLDALGGGLTLCGLDHDVQVGANILGLGAMVPIYETEDEAVAALQTSGARGAR